MKKLLFILPLFFIGFAFSQTPAALIDSARAYNDANIVTNNTKAITAVKVNTVVNKTLDAINGVKLFAEQQIKHVLVDSGLVATIIDDSTVLIGLDSSVGNGIPITGTDSVSGPVTGNIQFSGGEKELYTYIDDNYIGLLLGESGPSLNYANLSETASIGVSSTQVSVTGTNPSFKGLAGQSYYGNNADSLTYVQKKMLDDSIAAMRAIAGRLGIEDNTGVQDRSIDMGGFGLDITNTSSVNIRTRNYKGYLQLEENFVQLGSYNDSAYTGDAYLAAQTDISGTEYPHKATIGATDTSFYKTEIVVTPKTAHLIYKSAAISNVSPPDTLHFPVLGMNPIGGIKYYLPLAVRVNGVDSFANSLGVINLGTISGGVTAITGSNGNLGTATLVGGTVTVSTTAALTSSKIFVTVVTPGGTRGFISVPTITNATSFVINSTSATETSTVNWWIVN